MYFKKGMSVPWRAVERPPNVFDIEPRAPLGALARSHALLGTSYAGRMLAARPIASFASPTTGMRTTATMLTRLQSHGNMGSIALGSSDNQNAGMIHPAMPAQ